MDPEKEETAEQIISQEVDAVANYPARVKENGCAAEERVITIDLTGETEKIHVYKVSRTLTVNKGIQKVT